MPIQVYRITSYHAPQSPEAMEIMVRTLKKYTPNHKPLWTAVGVQRLAFDDMFVEIEVSAHVPSS